MTITDYISAVTKHLKPDYIGSVEFDLTLCDHAQVNDNGQSHITFTFTPQPKDSTDLTPAELQKLIGIDE